MEKTEWGSLQGVRPSTAATWILMHGTPLQPSIWQAAATRLTDQTVQLPDCTVVPEDRAQQQLAEQVAAKIGDHLVDVVGHSFGGQVALELALLRPKQVRTLTILCSRDTPFPAFAEAAAALRDQQLPAIDTTLARWFTPAELAASSGAVRQSRHQLQQASVADWANALDAIATYDRTTRTTELVMPVTLVAAQGDAVSAPQVMSEFAQRCPRARFLVNAGWMHMSPFVDPARLADLLRRARDRAIASGFPSAREG